MCDCEGNNYQINMGCCVPVVANPNIYYTKSEIDEKISGITTDGISEEKAQEMIDDSLGDYYTKDEIDAAFDSVNDELDGKLDASAYTPTDLTNYATKEWVEDKGYLTEHQHLKTINNISLIGDGNIEIGSGGTTDLSNYYTKSETNNLLDDKLDASAYTPTDLSGYYTKSQVDALIEALQAQIDDLSDCCSGSGDTGSTEGMKWVLHMNNGQSASLICNAPNDQIPHQIDDDEFVHTHRVLNTSDELSSITSAYVGECVYGILDNGFSGCTNMSSITVSDNLAYIGANGFGGCESLENFPYSTGLEVISGSAFAHCYSLTYANIPSGVTEIGSWAFQDCTGLTQVVMEGTTPPTLGNWAFYNEYGTAQLDITIYVPASAENAYKTASGWSEYASRIQAIS